MKCVRTEKHKVFRTVPRTQSQRFQRLQIYGKDAFVMPEGTPANPGIPAYPVVDKQGCFDCSLAKAAYSRLSQQISKKEYPAAYRNQLKKRRLQLIERVLHVADPGDKQNACNFAIAAAKRLGMAR